MDDRRDPLLFPPPSFLESDMTADLEISQGSKGACDRRAGFRVSGAQRMDQIGELSEGTLIGVVEGQVKAQRGAEK